MPFVALKFVEKLVMPAGLACLAATLALLLSWRRPWLSRLFLLAAIGLVGGLGNSAVAQRLIAPLETAYSVPPSGTKADAAVVLTGTVDLARSTPERVEFLDAPERLLEGVRLMRSGRVRTLVFAGGSGDPRHPDVSEAELLGGLAGELGVGAEHILLERHSRTTHENAMETARLLGGRGIRTFFLVTTASHMPRAMGSFRKAGLAPIPYPVDFRGTPPDSGPADYIPTAAALRLATTALHEYVGYAFYWVLGYL